ncbi:MAG: hypothetical protein AAF591_03580 [Verrucomicrobiota bacterium]
MNSPSPSLIPSRRPLAAALLRHPNPGRLAPSHMIRSWMMTLAAILATLLLLVTLAPRPAHAFTTLTIIDDFQSASHDLDLSGTTGSLNDTANGGPTIAGGRREIAFSVTSNPLGNAARTTVNNAGDGMLAMTLGGGAIGSTRLTYQGFNGTGLGGLDFTESGHNSLVFQVSSLNQATGLNLSITDTSGQTATLTTSLAGSLTPNNASFALSQFTNAGATDFTQVDALIIEFDAVDPATALQLEAVSLGNMPIAAAPEPGRGILLGIATLVLAGQRRRHPLRAP